MVKVRHVSEDMASRMIGDLHRVPALILLRLEIGAQGLELARMSRHTKDTGDRQGESRDGARHTWECAALLLTIGHVALLSPAARNPLQAIRPYQMVRGDAVEWRRRPVFRSAGGGSRGVVKGDDYNEEVSRSLLPDGVRRFAGACSGPTGREHGDAPDSLSVSWQVQDGAIDCDLCCYPGSADPVHEADGAKFWLGLPVGGATGSIQ